VAVEHHTNDARTKPDQEPKEITPLEKYVMAVAVLTALVPILALFFLPLAG
jgi:hypothetical protein